MRRQEQNMKSFGNNFKSTSAQAQSDLSVLWALTHWNAFQSENLHSSWNHFFRSCWCETSFVSLFFSFHIRRVLDEGEERERKKNKTVPTPHRIVFRTPSNADCRIKERNNKLEQLQKSFFHLSEPVSLVSIQYVRTYFADQKEESACVCRPNTDTPIQNMWALTAHFSRRILHHICMYFYLTCLFRLASPKKKNRKKIQLSISDWWRRMSLVQSKNPVAVVCQMPEPHHPQLSKCSNAGQLPLLLHLLLLLLFLAAEPRRHWRDNMNWQSYSTFAYTLFFGIRSFHIQTHNSYDWWLQRRVRVCARRNSSVSGLTARGHTAPAT